MGTKSHLATSSAFKFEIRLELRLFPLWSGRWSRVRHFFFLLVPLDSAQLLLNASLLPLHLFLLLLVYGGELPYEGVVLAGAYFGVGVNHRSLAHDLDTRVLFALVVAESAVDLQYSA